MVTHQNARCTCSAGACVLVIATLLTSCAKHDPSTYQGYVEGEFVNVASSVGGRLQRLLVQRGQTVEANAALFELEASEESAAVREAGEKLTAASAQRADLGTGKRRPEIEVLRAQLAQAQAMERQSASQLARDTAQLAAGGVSKTQVEEAHAKHEVDAARVNELLGQLEVAGLSARPEQIRAKSSEVAAAQASLEQAQWRLDQKQVSAAQAGVVTDTLYREGEWVAAGAPILRILPPANVKVRFFIPQADLARFPLGSKVEVRCDGCDRAIPASVTYRAAEAEYTPPVIYSNDMRSKLVFMLEAHPDPEAAPLLHPGQPVEIRGP